MEGVSAIVFKGLKGYWQRKGYERLNSGGRRRQVRDLELNSAADSSTAARRRWFWRFKLTPQLKLKLRFSPKKLLLDLRDAYVNLRMRIANTRAVTGGFSGGSGFPGDGVIGFGARSIKGYDERMIVEIYKSIVVAGNISMDLGFGGMKARWGWVVGSRG